MACANVSSLSARNRMAQPGQLSSLISPPILSAVLASKPICLQWRTLICINAERARLPQSWLDGEDDA
jgi:hypothetical protein